MLDSNVHTIKGVDIMMFFLTILLFALPILIFLFYGITGKGHKPARDVVMTKEEFVRCLDFMLMHNIIDYTQYNEILVKGVQFTRG